MGNKFATHVDVNMLIQPKTVGLQRGPCHIEVGSSRQNDGHSIEPALVRIPVGTVSNIGHFRYPHDAPVQSAV